MPSPSNPYPRSQLDEDMNWDWVEDAKCRGHSRSYIFDASIRGDESGVSQQTKVHAVQALAICNGEQGEEDEPCPVRDECLATALQGRYDGIWGGTTYQQRRDYMRRR